MNTTYKFYLSLEKLINNQKRGIHFGSRCFKRTENALSFIPKELIDSLEKDGIYITEEVPPVLELNPPEISEIIDSLIEWVKDSATKAIQYFETIENPNPKPIVYELNGERKVFTGE